MNRTQPPVRPPARPRGTLARVFADPRFDPLQRGAARRRASVVQLAATALLFAGLGAVVAWPQAPVWLYPVAALALFLPFMIATGRLNASVAGVTELRTRELDEAQRLVRGRAYRRAYPAVGVALVTFLVATFGFADGWMPAGALVALGAVAFFVWIGAPVHVLAWTMPDVGDEN